MERRAKHSEHRDEALQFLVEAIADRSEVRAVALIDARGGIVAGTGVLDDLRGLASIAAASARGEQGEEFERITDGTDVMARAIVSRMGTLYLAALGSRIRRMRDAVEAVARIDDLVPAPY